MSSSIRFYLLNDISPYQAALFEAFKQAGLNPNHYQPRDKADFLSNLAEHNPAVIVLCDEGANPASTFHFGQIKKWLAEEKLKIPIWMINRPENERTAVNAMFNGLADYFFTDRLARIGPAAARLVGQTGQTLEPVNLNEIVEGVLADYQPVFQARGLALTFLPAVDLPLVYGKQGALTQAVLTILEYVVVDAPDQTKTGLRPYLDAVKGEVCLEIQLSGEGLQTEEQIEQMMNVTEVTLQGAIEMVESQHGQVDIGSGGETGIRICLYFPAILEKEIEGNPNLLVVENSHLMRSILQEALVQEGFMVQTAEHGADALEKMADFQPDLVISDIKMPIMDGFAFFEVVRETPEWQEIPFIFVTGQSDQRDHLNMQVLRGATYLIKPIVIEELMVAVRARLRSH